MRVYLMLLFMIMPVSSVWCDEEHHHALTENEVGSVDFLTSCSKLHKHPLNDACDLRSTLLHPRLIKHSQISGGAVKYSNQFSHDYRITQVLPTTSFIVMTIRSWQSGDWWQHGHTRRLRRRRHTHITCLRTSSHA